MSTESLRDALWAKSKTAVYAVLNAAAEASLLPRLQSSGLEHECLFPGEIDSELAACAPFLVTLDRDHELTGWLLAEGWGKSWGVFLRSSAPQPEVLQHLRRLLKVKTEEGKKLVFRFYDPRVLQVLLPTCNDEQLTEAFGPVESFLTESEDGQARWIESCLSEGEFYQAALVAEPADEVAFLADGYPQTSAIKSVWKRAGGSEEQIPLGLNSVDSWDALLVRADAEGLSAALRSAVEVDHPDGWPE
jgi:hypothetical protein